MAFLFFHSSSIGIGDTIATHDALTQIDTIISSAKRSVGATIAQARGNGLKREPGSTIMETFERKVNDYLNEATKEAGKTVRASLNKLNNIRQMVDAGSKGSALNISQIIACVGQQNVNGKRIPYGFRQRTLPHFNRDDLQPESRGIVIYLSQLCALCAFSFYMHASLRFAWECLF